jgi:hypothetical protein
MPSRIEEGLQNGVFHRRQLGIVLVILIQEVTYA